MLKEDLEGSIANTISAVVQEERQAYFREMTKFQESTALEISSIKEEFQSAVNVKLAEISEL